MAGLRLAMLPERAPVKVTFLISPELHRALLLYTELYEEAYNRADPLGDLVPAMLEAFLQSDRLFQSRRRRGR